MNEILGLRQRTTRNVKKVKLILLTLPRGSLDDVSRDRVRGPTQLAGQSANLFFGESFRAFVNRNRQIVRKSPRFNFGVVSHGLLSCCLLSAVWLSRALFLRGTIALASIVWTISPRWFVVTLRNRMMP
jgi:hypothetical protein